MPPIKIQHIVSFSSEDKVYKAENLLKSDAYRKWKCATQGEKQASVVLQLEKAIEIQSIDIGNEGSAFIEVLVGRSSEAKDDYQVLLVASSFMTPAESRQGTSLNKVRMFGPDNLSQTAIKDKWDRIKVVCTQPFNKNIQYGLSFITLTSPPNASEVASPKTPLKQTTLGQFKMKDDEEDKVQVGSWFTRHQEKKTPDPLTGPAAIRQASVSTENSPTTSKGTSNNLMSFSNKIKVEPKEKTGTQSSSQNIQSRKRKVQDDENAASSSKKKKDDVKPFYELMKDVVFAMSGFQNPLRAEIRDKALAMGAKYKSDWTDACTHLVCAFLNTPKYQQVKSKGGKVVKKDWILDNHKKRTSLPWKKYRLDNSKDDPSSSESEPEVKVKKLTPKPKPTTSNEVTSMKETKEPKRSETGSTSNDVFEADTDVDGSSGGDTEDELVEARNTIQASKKKRTNSNAASGTKQDTSKLPLPRLPNIFEDIHFFLHSDLSTSDRNILQRFILGCFGEIENYMSESINFVLTNDKWNRDFHDALLENQSLKFVKPLWILNCIEKESLLPYEDYEITE